MKIAVCFLAVLCSVVAREIPLQTPDELDVTKLTPIDLHLEPINPAKPEDIPWGRIIGGSEVTRNSVPYQAALVIDNSGFCGASLISHDRVLTAAHCTDRASSVQVRLGAHNVNNNENTQVRVTSSRIFNHANYNQGSFAANDVAFVILPSSVTLNNAIRTISLAPANSGTFAGSTGFLAGWGRVGSSNSISPTLQGVNLPIITNAVCANSFGNSIVASSLCTSGTGIRGACNGDSGGPLVVNGVQVGIVSFGATNCMGGHPSVFARVSSFRNWIASNSGV